MLEGPRSHRQSFAELLGVHGLAALNFCLFGNYLSLILHSGGHYQRQVLLHFYLTQAFLTGLDRAC